MMSSSVLDGKIPFEGLHQWHVSYEHLKIFGFFCYVVDLHNTDKLINRATESLFLGYAVNQKGYILLNLSRRTIFVSRDVTFRDNIFPSKNRTTHPICDPLVNPVTDTFDYAVEVPTSQAEVSDSQGEISPIVSPDEPVSS